MSERNSYKAFSILIALVLVLGVIGPMAETVGESETLNSDSTLASDDGTWEINDTYTINEDEERDVNIVINGTEAHLRIIDSNLTLRMDENEHLYNITVKNGGQLTLSGGAIQTKAVDLNRPFLKTDVTVTNGSKLSLRDDSSFRFPGFVNIFDGSELEMINSTFEALDDDEIPSYDYLWGIGKDESVEDNNDGPRLIVENRSEVYMENSEINDYYRLKDDNVDAETYKEMKWSYLDSDEDIGTGEEYKMKNWTLDNPFVGDVEDYPYINPINKISSLFVEVTFDEYNGTGNLEYWSPSEDRFIRVKKLNETDIDNTVTSPIWEKELSEFSRVKRDGETVLMLDQNVTVRVNTTDNMTISKTKLYSSYDNDIHIVNSNFTVINSLIDVDIYPSDIDPRNEETTNTSSSTYLQNSDMKHKTIRLYDNSSFRCYGLEITEDDPNDVNNEGDPWILNTETSHDQTWIYRWVNLKVTTEEGDPLEDVELYPIPKPMANDTLEAMVNETINDPTEPHNRKAWDYLNETGYGHYDRDEEVYRTDEDGNVTLFLASDRINYPDDWSNSKFVGNYYLNASYVDEGQNINVTRTREIPNLEDFPTMENPQEFNIDLPVKLPDLQAEELEVEDNILPGDNVTVEMNVSNIGDGDAYDVNVSFYEGEFDWDNPEANYFNSTTIDRLNATDNQWVNVTWEAPEESGKYDLRGVVDPHDNINEKDTEKKNNENKTVVEVLEKANYTVTIGNYVDNVVEGEDQTVDYTIENTGDALGNQTITFTVYNASDLGGVENHTDEEENLTLEGGDTYSGQFTWSSESEDPGNYSFEVASEDDNKMRNFDVIEEPFFEVTIDDSEAEIVEGEDQVVDYTVENTGEAEATQDIVFEVYNASDLGGTVIDTQTEPDVTLDGGQTYSDTFTWTSTDPGEYSFNVSSADRSVFENFDVIEEADFEITIDAFDTEVVEGEDQVVEYTVNNTGEATATQYIEFVVYDAEGEIVYTAEEQVTIDGGNNHTNSFTWTSEEPGEEYSFEVASEDDSESRDFDVLVASFFEVDIDLNQSDSEIIEGENLTVVVDIENTGADETEITQTIVLYDEEDPDTTLDSKDVTLAADEDDSVMLTWDTGVNDAGNYTLQVASEDDEDDLDVTLLRIAEFTVNIDTEASDTEGVEGQDFNIVADIENIGEEDRVVTQTINLTDEAGNVLDHQNVTLGPGQMERVNLTWETEFGDAGDETQTFRLEVASADDDDRIFIDLTPAPDLNFVTETWYVDGEEIDPEEGFDLEEGDTLTFEGQIRNDGGTPIFNAEVNYLFPDNTRDNQVKDVEVDETVNVSAEWNVRVVENPEISIWVNSTGDKGRTHDNITYSGDDFEDIEATEIRFEDLNFPGQEMIPGESYSFSGRVLRDQDDKPLEGINVTVSIQSNPILVEETVSTDENGEFEIFLQIPADAEGGEYSLEFEAQTHEPQDTQESVEIETDVLEVAGIPWWLLLVIVAIAAGGAGTAFAYFKFFGVGEMVECGNCGATISADATSCPKCGVEFDMNTVKCSECGEWIPADSDVCPECGAEFIKTGKEVEDYTERMKKQYKKFLRKQHRKAQKELGKELSQKEFLDWWKDKPSFVTFNEWLERKEKQRKEGSVECPECGTLNSVDDAVCQKCGTSLIDLGEEEETEEEMTFEEELEEESSEEEEEIPEPTEEEPIEEESQESEEKTEESEEKEETEETGEAKKKVKKKPKKKVKKRVVKKPDEEED
ncbi:MAG: hypothetical protein KGY68_01070 [Candidatus Thermoplasmatota archaeon]|nr:hypothetical protein [Candidatus Thermoplasmatota archaeon]